MALYPRIAQAWRLALGQGGLNFDSKVRRQSIDPDDLLAAHVHSMDACARALIVAARMLDEGALNTPLAERYAGWDSEGSRAILDGRRSLDDVAAAALAAPAPQPRSGRQEILEGLVNRYI